MHLFFVILYLLSAKILIFQYKRKLILQALSLSNNVFLYFRYASHALNMIWIFIIVVLDTNIIFIRGDVIGMYFLVSKKMPRIDLENKWTFLKCKSKWLSCEANIFSLEIMFVHNCISILNDIDFIGSLRLF